MKLTTCLQTARLCAWDHCSIQICSQGTSRVTPISDAIPFWVHVGVVTILQRFGLVTTKNFSEDAFTNA